MHISIIEGNSTDKIRRTCYDYLKEKYRREKLYDSRLCKGEYGGTSEERVQSEGPGIRVPKEGPK
jgi:hypothetical protein